MEKHCYACHDARKAKAGFRVDTLWADMLSGKTADQWKEVMDHVNLGEMPPEEEPRPYPKVSFAFVSRISEELRRA
jgi:hypothetical protein